MGRPVHLNQVEVKRRRDSLGLTQEQAAKRAGVNGRARWADIETGERHNVTLSTLYAIARALECRPADLLMPSEDR